MKITIRDERTAEQKSSTIGYVSARDKFMSGWGQCPGVSYAVWALSENASITIEELLERIENRSEMRNVESHGPDFSPEKDLFLQNGDHCSIYFCKG